VVEHANQQRQKTANQDHVPWGPDPGIGQLRADRIRQAQSHDESHQDQERPGLESRQHTEQTPKQSTTAHDGKEHQPEERAQNSLLHTRID
jgi:hypothetical protein